MTLTLDLSPELERYLKQEAGLTGLPVDVLALQLLSDSIERKQKQTDAINTLQAWIDSDDDTESQQETGQYLIKVLDEDRLSERKLFPTEMKGITW